MFDTGAKRFSLENLGQLIWQCSEYEDWWQWQDGVVMLVGSGNKWRMYLPSDSSTVMFPGKDNCVCTAQMKTSSWELSQPVSTCLPNGNEFQYQHSGQEWNKTENSTLSLFRILGLQLQGAEKSDFTLLYCSVTW